MTKILVLGYYHRKNLGDDVFEYVLSKYFQQRWENINYEFLSIDDLKEISNDTTAVLFGGGDLINDYFYRKINPFLLHKTCPWYAISIGIPYPKLIEQGYLDRFDYIIYRSQIDSINRNIPARWYPDMSFLLPHYHHVTENFFKNKTKKIGIFLSRTVYNRLDPSAYTRIVNNISKFLSGLAQETHSDMFRCRRSPTYELYLLPFCTDNKDNHDDRLINLDVYNKIKKYGCLNNVYLYDQEISMDNIIPIFNSFYATICTRFHAHIFSLMAKVPILSIYTTRKVENMLTEIGAIDYSCRMETHKDGYPINVDDNLLTQKFEKIVSEYNVYKEKLNLLHNMYTTKTFEFEKTLDNLLFYLPRYVQPDEINQKALIIGKRIAEKLNSMIKIEEDYSDVFGYTNLLVNHFEPVSFVEEILHKTGAIGDLFSSDNSQHQNIIELISYELTGERRSIYYHGLKEQVFTTKYNLKESCRWILNNKYKIANNDNYQFLNNTEFPLSDRKLNVKHINSNLFNGYHRSGWNFVQSKLEELHNPNGIIFDSYLDKTFGWEYDFLSTAQIIPYQRPWMGVLHHTNNAEYTENNLVNVFEKSAFQESLKYCKGLIVLSKSNQTWVISQLCKEIPVLSLTHPTEFVPDHLKFDYRLFKSQQTKEIIQIGAWLRDSYAIYELKVPTNFVKFALKGRDMNNYFISEENLQTILFFTRGIASGKPRESCYLSGNRDINKYIVGLTTLIETNHHSVTVIENVNNHQYDNILKSSIVFIKLVDASAVNTILECVVRNTPILVNRLPATEEYLGKNYPLFYDDLDHANRLLSDTKNIKKAHKYLRKLPKEKFHIEHFLKTIVSSDLYLNL